MSYDKQKVISLAISQIGYKEKATNSDLDNPTANSGDKNWNKYARDLDQMSGFYNGRKNGYAWCDVFVDWCFVTAYGRAAAQFLLCQPDRSAGAGCSFSAQYFRNKGQFHVNNPQTGDQIFFGTGPNNVWHTGIVVEVTSSHVVTVEGNTTDSVGRRSYRLNDSSIYGYGRPDWGTQESTSTPATTTPKAPSVTVEVPVVSKPTQMCSPRIPLLKKGSEGGYVKVAQILLGERGFSCGGKTDPVTKQELYDGEFGSSTENSVKEFQSKSGLLADGEIGANTWAALLNL